MSLQYVESQKSCVLPSPLVLAPSCFSPFAQLYALATALCVASAKTTKRSGSQDRDRQGGDTPAADAMGTDDTLNEGPSFGRLVVDGCCHAFAEALGKVHSIVDHSIGVMCKQALPSPLKLLCG